MLAQFVGGEGLVLGWNFRKSAGRLDRPRALEDAASLMEATLQKSEQRRVRHEAKQPEVRLCPEGRCCDGHASKREARNSASARVNFCGDAIRSDARVGERVRRRRRRWRRHGRRRRGRAGPGCSAWPGSAAPRRAVHWLRCGGSGAIRSRCAEVGCECANAENARCEEVFFPQRGSSQRGGL